MATSYTLSLLLNAIDKASGPIKDVVDGLSQLGQSAQQATAASKETGTAGADAMQNFRAAIAEARVEMEGLYASAGKVATAAIQIAAAGAAMSAAFLFPVSQAAEFEHAMSQVMAITHATQAEMQAMSETAIQLGLVTKFTGTQIAEGMNYMARAGLSATEIIAALPAVVNLATAAEVDMGEASSVMVSIIKSMGVGIGDLTHVTDVLAYASTHANQSFSELGDALKIVGPAAKATGTDIDSLTAMIDVLALSGIKSHMAGTELRQMFVELSKPTTAAAQTLRDMGIVVTDTTGKLRPMIDILQDLKAAHMDLEQAATLFNARTATAALALSENVDKVKALDETEKQLIGTAKEMAEIMVDNVAGAWVNFKATIEAFSDAMAGPLLSGIKTAIDAVNVFLQTITKLVTATQPLGAIFLALIGIIGGALVIFGGLGLVISGLLSGLGMLTAMFGTAGGAAVAGTAATGTFAIGLGFLSAAAGVAAAAMEALISFLLLTPWGLIITSAAVAAYELYQYANASDTAAKSAREQSMAAQKTRAEFEETYGELKKTTEGSREHNQIIAQLIATYPELATQLSLTNQTWEEQQAILDRFSTAKVVDEVQKIGTAAKATSEQIAAMSDKLNDPGLWEKVKALNTAIGTGMLTALTGGTSPITAAVNTYFQLLTAKLDQNQKETADAAKANSAAFKKMFDDMGIATKDWVSMSKDQLQDLWDSQTGETAKFSEALHKAFGDFETFLKAVQQAQGVTKVETPAPAAMKTAAEQVVAEANSALEKVMKGVPDSLASQVRNLATFMTDTLEKVPVGVRAAWLEEVTKMTKDFEKLGDKGKEAINMLAQAMQALNLNTMMGQLTALGPKLAAIPGTETTGYKAGADISQMRAKMGDVLASQVQAAVEATAQKLGVDPALVYAIISKESGFAPEAFNPAGGGLGAAGLGQFRSGTSQAVLARMGMPGLTGEQAQQQAMDPTQAAKMVTTYVRMLQEDCQAAGKEANLWNILFGYRGGAAIPAAEMQAYYNDVVKRMASMGKGGGALVTEQDLETTKKLLELQAKEIEDKQKAGITGAASAAQQKGAIEQQVAVTTVQITEAKLAEAMKHGTAEQIHALQDQLVAEKAAVVASASATALEVTGIERKQLQQAAADRIKAAQEAGKDAEAGLKVQEAVWAQEKAALSSQYESGKISALSYYSAIGAMDQKDYEAKKAILSKELTDIQAAQNKAKTAQEQATQGQDPQARQNALLKQQNEALQQTREIKTKINELDSQYLQGLEKQDAELKKQQQTDIDRYLVELKISTAQGPIEEQNAKVQKVMQQQTDEKRKFVALLEQEVALNKINPTMGMTQGQADAYTQQLQALQKIQLIQTQVGQQAKQWADTITQGFSQLVDSMMQGGQNIQQSINKLFQDMFKQSLKPMMEQMSQLLQTGLTKIFGAGGTVSNALMNGIMGLIAIVGMMFTSGGKGSFSASGATSNVQPAEAERGVIAGETTIPIADISQSLEEALVDTNGILLQIEQNTRQGGPGASQGGSNVTLTVNIPNWQQTLQAAVLKIMQTYFASYLVHGAPA